MTEVTGTEVQTDTLELESYFTEEVYKTPYQVRNVVNKILQDLMGDEYKELPGPMFYTYAKKGYLKTVEGTNNKHVAKADAIAWTEKYIAKRFA